MRNRGKPRLRRGEGEEGGSPVTDEHHDARVHAHRHARLERVLLVALAVVLVYTLIAYLLLPAVWTHYEHQKGLATMPMVTHTAQGHSRRSGQCRADRQRKGGVVRDE
jgi:hypothetical protein